jgi:hypothetical protein
MSVYVLSWPLVRCALAHMEEKKRADVRTCRGQNGAGASEGQAAPGPVEQSTYLRGPAAATPRRARNVLSIANN